MFFENEADRLLRRFFSDPFFGFGDSPGARPALEDEEQGGNLQSPRVQYYGLVMTMGPDGRPVIHEYGNVGPAGRPQGQQPGPGAPETRQLQADTIVDEKSRLVKIIVEMPGVEKRDIKIAVEDKHVDVSAAAAAAGADGSGRRYQVRAPLKHRVDANSARATYRNGILQITFRLAGGTHKKTVRVE